MSGERDVTDSAGDDCRQRFVAHFEDSIESDAAWRKRRCDRAAYQMASLVSG